MDTPAARLEKRFKGKRRLVESEIRKTEKAALRHLLKEGRVVRVGAYYLAGYEPTRDSECERIVAKLLSQPSLFRRTALISRLKETQPLFRSALSKLLADKQVIKLDVRGGDKDCFIHRDHLVAILELSGPPSKPSKARPSKAGNGSTKPEETRKELTLRIREAYQRVAQERGRRSIFISELLRNSGTSWDELRGWIEQEVVEKGQGQLDEGDWGAATEEQRAAAVELWGRKRLYIALAA